MLEKEEFDKAFDLICESIQETVTNFCEEKKMNVNDSTKLSLIALSYMSAKMIVLQGVLTNNLPNALEIFRNSLFDQIPIFMEAMGKHEDQKNPVH